MPPKLPRRYDERTMVQLNRQRQFDAEFQSVLGSSRTAAFKQEGAQQNSPLTTQMGQLDLRGVPSRSMPNLQRQEKNGPKKEKSGQKSVNDYFDQVLSWVDEIEDPRPSVPEQRQRSASHSHYHPYHSTMKRHSGPSPSQQMPSPTTFSPNYMPQLIQGHHKTNSAHASYHSSIQNVNNVTSQVKRHSGQSGSSNKDMYYNGNEYQVQTGRYASRSSSVSSVSNLSYYNPNPVQWPPAYKTQQQTTNFINNNHLMYNQQWNQIPHIVVDENFQQNWYAEF